MMKTRKANPKSLPCWVSIDRSISDEEKSFRASTPTVNVVELFSPSLMLPKINWNAFPQCRQIHLSLSLYNKKSFTTLTPSIQVLRHFSSSCMFRQIVSKHESLLGWTFRVVVLSKGGNCQILCCSQHCLSKYFLGYLCKHQMKQKIIFFYI